MAGIADHHLHAARLLGLAEETAARVTSRRTRGREHPVQRPGRVREVALRRPQRVRADADRGQEHSESTVADATAKAEATVRDSQIKAEALDREAQRKYSEVMSQLTTQRTTLENKIDGLRTYEREYRSRLKNWINDQLHQLDAPTATAPPTARSPSGKAPGSRAAGRTTAPGAERLRRP